MSASDQPQAGPLFRARTVLVMVLVGVVSFSALLVLSAYAPDLRSGSDGGAHALSRSAVGYAGLVELLKGLGEAPIISRGTPPPVRGGSGLLILTPTPATEPKEIPNLRFSGAVLVVLPKWQTAPQPLNPRWVDRIGLLPPELVVHSMGGGRTVERRNGVSRPVLQAAPDAPIFPANERFPLGPVDSFQTLSGPMLTPLLVDASGRTVLAMSRVRPILVLSDPDLLNNHGLADLTTARSAVGILGDLRAGGPVVFDVTLAGFSRGRSLLRLAFEPPFVGASLCLAVAALLMGLHAWVRFGPAARPARALALGKRALADNSAALVRMAKREPLMAEPYAVLTRDAVARTVGAPRDLSPDQLEALLDRLGAARGVNTTFSSLAAEARRAGTTADLMQAAQKLFQWRGEMRRDRR